jgi:hypothetical protein
VIVRDGTTSLKEVDDRILSEALARRAEQSGMFPDSDDPANYTRLADLERRAQRLISVECRPKGNLLGTVGAGSIMDHARNASATINSQVEANSSSAQERPTRKTHRKITESKL